MGVIVNSVKFAEDNGFIREIDVLRKETEANFDQIQKWSLIVGKYRKQEDEIV